MVVVDVDPVLQGLVAVVFGEVGAGVDPFFGQGPVEPFDFAVGLGPVGPGPDMFDVTEGALEGSGSVSVPVVGHDRFDGDAMVSEELLGPLPETAQVSPLMSGRVST